MEGPNGKTFHTNQYAIVAHGKAEKEWPFLTCSDSKFTEVRSRFSGDHCGLADFSRPNTTNTNDRLLPTVYELLQCPLLVLNLMQYMAC